MARTRTTFSKANPPTNGFKPGRSGNPGGRPKTLHDLIEAARALTPRALAALDKALDDPDRAIPAAVALLDRAWGKPPIAVFAQVNTGPFEGGIDAPPRETLEEWMERRRRTLAALDGPPQKHAPGEGAQLFRGSSPGPSLGTGTGLARSSSPNGESAAPVAPAEHAPQRTAAPPRAFGSNAANSADSAGPSTRSMTEQEKDWLAIRRRELGIEPDGPPRPNPGVKR